MNMGHSKLEVRRLIKRMPEKVFKTWIDASLMKHWFSPQDMHPSKVETDARVGGKYSISMTGNGETHTAVGIYKEVLPFQKLVFTHGWDIAEKATSIVTVKLINAEGRTEVILTHEGLTAENFESHREGWESTMDNLSNFLARG